MIKLAKISAVLGLLLIIAACTLPFSPYLSKELEDIVFFRCIILGTFLLSFTCVVIFKEDFYLKNILTTIMDYTEGPMEKSYDFQANEYEQITYVAKGQLFVTIGEKKRHLRKGSVFYIAANKPYSIQTLSKNVRLVSSYSPIPEEFQKH